MTNPCAVTAECLERLLAFYEENVPDDDCDYQLVQTARECVEEMLRPLNCEELVDLEPHCTNAKRILEKARAS